MRLIIGRDRPSVAGHATTLSLVLDLREQKVNTPAWMTGIASLTIHLSWSGSPVASARGADRIGCLAAKFGPEISLRDLTDRFSYDGLWRAEARSKCGRSSCGVYLPDLSRGRRTIRPAAGNCASSRTRNRRAACAIFTA
jgi:hypothetical protein